jgi:tetratricopeptide (TPR) repeat protein
VAIWRNNLGSVLRDLGDLEGARVQYERALAISEATLGSNHPDMATQCANLGAALRDLGDLEGAKEQYERALAIGEAALSPDHPTVTTWRNNLGRVLGALQKEAPREDPEQAL